VDDGIFGPQIQAALVAASDDQEKVIQCILGVEQDGIFGKRSRVALTDAIAASTILKAPPIGTGTDAYASSFADIGDVKASINAGRGGQLGKILFQGGDNGMAMAHGNGHRECCIAALRARDIAAKWDHWQGDTVSLSK